MTRLNPFSGCQPVEAIQARKTLKTAQGIDPLGAGYLHSNHDRGDASSFNDRGAGNGTLQNCGHSADKGYLSIIKRASGVKRAGARQQRDATNSDTYRIRLSKYS